MKLEALLVTCNMEQSRSDLMQGCLRTLDEGMIPGRLTVFDNASTFPGTMEALAKFSNVYRASRNVGYWSAIDWWLTQLWHQGPPDHVLIIESDVGYHHPHLVREACEVLDGHGVVGGCRLHEWSFPDRRLFDKDRPCEGSRRDVWQSSTNRVTGQQVEWMALEQPGWYASTYLAKVDGVNRFMNVFDTFQYLGELGEFSEADFQREMWKRSQCTAIHSGGAFTPLSGPDDDVVSGSWTGARRLAELGYQPTRQASIQDRDTYTVERVR
jgi:hypothetical protein